MAELLSSNGTTPVILDDDTLDLETALLLARLELEDLQDIENARKGKQRHGVPLNDEQRAFKIQEEYLQGIIRTLADLKFARSLDQALMTDATQIQQLAMQEQVAEDDRRAAIALSNGQAMPPTTPAQRAMDMLIRTPNGTSEARSSRPPAAQRTPQTPSSSSYHMRTSNAGQVPVPATKGSAPVKRVSFVSSAPGSSVNRNERVECTGCLELHSKATCLRTPCEHYYCRGCIKNLVEAFLQDESLYPLRCCQKPMTIETVVTFLSLSLQQRFQVKNREYATPALNRVYCQNGTCSQFLGSSANGAEDIRCTACGSLTCGECKQSSHPGKLCKDNPDVAQLKELASQERWQTCPGCKSIVELNTGCYHITCRCRTEFCYVCAVPWKNCTCPQWEEHRLLAAAERRVENRLGANAAARAPTHVFDRLVQDMRNTLQNNHDCVYHSWTRRSGGGICEECHWNLPNFLMICRHCSLLVCLRCSRNRL
ncbi:hypothetical protein BDQ17DRAFT_1351449 [Cyathus striatus]|nr:hypothetical protein BDQ17DRAFT_1351449 [Cyathus striatus]